MVCLHTCLQSLCAEANLVMRGYYTAEKTCDPPPPLLSSACLSHFLLFSYDNVVGERDALLGRLLWSPLFPHTWRWTIQCPRRASWVWPWDISGVHQQQKHPHSNKCCVCLPFRVGAGVSSAENQVLNWRIILASIFLFCIIISQILSSLKLLFYLLVGGIRQKTKLDIKFNTVSL